ncbi:MAG: hypothetical protein KA792_11160, partial [Bacteroidales bacterium]|nr:hypothetical protein [Bacteroidales bacterium]
MQKIFINSKRFRIALLSILLLFIFLVSCKKDKDDENNNNNPPVVSGETVIATSSVTLGANGGIVSLTDGAAINIAAGVLSTDTKITISKIGNEVNFAADNRYCYEITGLSAGIKVTLVFPCEKGKYKDFVGVLNYNPDDLTGVAPPFTYDSINGKINVDNFTLEKKAIDGTQKRRWIVEWDDKQDYGAEEKIIPVPYYEQISETCWATDATMLTKAYKTNTSTDGETEVKDFLKEMQIDLLAGIGPIAFNRNFPKAFKKLSGVSATSKTYWIKNNLLQVIISKLRDNKPVLISMPNIGHALLIIGFRTYVDETGYDNYELVVHDSKGVNPPSGNDGTMYTMHKWSWFLQKTDWRFMFFIMFPDVAVPKQTQLQTIVMPTGAGESYLSFMFTIPPQKYSANLAWNISKQNGYGIYHINGSDFDPIPKDVYKLKYKFQIYNADLNNEKTADVLVKITNNKKYKPTFEKRYPIQIEVNKAPVYISDDLDSSLWLKNYGDTTVIPYELEVMLVSSISDLYLDGWKIKFNVKGGLPSKNYIKSYNSPPATHLIYNKYYSANVAIGI